MYQTRKRRSSSRWRWSASSRPRRRRPTSPTRTTSASAIDEAPVQPPTEAQERQFYERLKSGGQIPPDATFESLKDRIGQALVNQQRQTPDAEGGRGAPEAGQPQDRPAAAAGAGGRRGPGPRPEGRAGHHRGVLGLRVPVLRRRPRHGGAGDEQLRRQGAARVPAVPAELPPPRGEGRRGVALCAPDQGKFWEYHDVLFKNQKKLEPTDLKAHATEVGLDAQKFGQCLDSGDKKKAGRRRPAGRPRRPGWAERRPSSSTASSSTARSPSTSSRRSSTGSWPEVSRARERIAWAADVPLDDALRLWPLLSPVGGGGEGRAVALRRARAGGGPRLPRAGRGGVPGSQAARHPQHRGERGRRGRRRWERRTSPCTPRVARRCSGRRCGARRAGRSGRACRLRGSCGDRAHLALRRRRDVARVRSLRRGRWRGAWPRWRCRPARVGWSARRRRRRALRARHAGVFLCTPGIRPAGVAAGDQARVETPAAAIAAGLEPAGRRPAAARRGGSGGCGEGAARRGRRGAGLSASLDASGLGPRPASRA